MAHNAATAALICPTLIREGEGFILMQDEEDAAAFAPFPHLRKAFLDSVGYDSCNPSEKKLIVAIAIKRIDAFRARGGRGENVPRLSEAGVAEIENKGKEGDNNTPE